MADYWCPNCGGRTSMMGHAHCNPRLLALIDRLVVEVPVNRSRAVAVVGAWQIGEASLPRDDPQPIDLAGEHREG